MVLEVYRLFNGDSQRLADLPVRDMDIWQCRNLGGGVLLASRGERPGMLLDILQQDTKTSYPKCQC